MSWSAISEALSARISALYPASKVHTRIRYIREPAESPEFIEAYSSADGTRRIDCWQITRTGGKRVLSEQGARYRVQHEAKIHHHRSVLDCDCESSEDDFQAEIDAVLTDLINGDRTLSDVCITLSDAEAQDIGHAMLAEQVLCHYGSISVTIEELEASPTSETLDLMMSGIWRPIGNALLAWLEPQLSGLLPALVSCDWDSGASKAPSMPLDPRTECPRVLLRYEPEIQVDLLTNKGEYDVGRGALWVQLRQPIGDSHHERLVAYADAVAAPFFGQQRPDGLQAVGVEFMQITSIVYHDPLEHPLGEAALRVSTAEIQFEIKVRRYP
ncbi:MAG: hypothetical protein E6Q97_08880 [Desulfurellales bacterium]|nr:MAG: hypothetical protein E6Q97_08880 [Desulfurellales bacterium]